MESKIIAKWQSVGGAHYVELWKHHGSGWSYRSSNASGYLGNDFESNEAAIAAFELRVNDFQPDRNKIPMKRLPI